MPKRLICLSLLLMTIFILCPPVSADGNITILSEPEDAEGFAGDALSFAVYAAGTGENSLSYSWYWREEAPDGSILEDSKLSDGSGVVMNADGSALTLTVTDEMLESRNCLFVYCIISDRDGNVARTRMAQMTALDPDDFAFTISYRPTGELSAGVGEELILSASVLLAGERLGDLHYQWYSCDNSDGSDAVPLYGENKPYLQIPTAKAGTRYYFCSVVNEKHGRSFTSEKSRPVKATVIGPTAADDSDGRVLPFVDVDESEWYYPSVLRAYEYGIINGKSETTFCPDDRLTVAEAVKLAVCIHRYYSDGAAELPSTVRPHNVWYLPYYEYALTNRLIEGELAVGANEYITRGELAALLYRLLPAGEYAEINQIPDGAVKDIQLSSPGYTEIMTLLRAGIMTVGEDGSFGAGETVARSEAAAYIERMLDRDARYNAG